MSSLGREADRIISLARQEDRRARARAATARLSGPCEIGSPRGRLREEARRARQERLDLARKGWQAEPGEDRSEDQRWTPPPDDLAFDGRLGPVEVKRLKSARARRDACGRGDVIQVEHRPCGSCYWIRYGCNTRICDGCASKYRARKAARFEPLARLHTIVRGGEEVRRATNADSLKFVTLTFPNVDWADPAECREWITSRTKRLREFFGKDAAPNWAIKGYLAVWEVTPERVCLHCSTSRGSHDPKGRRPNCPGWTEGARTGRWHPHLHLLLWSNFIPIRQLVARWKAWTGAHQVDLSAVEESDPKKAVGYLLKYLGKSWAGVPEDLQIAALYRVRRVTSVGEFYSGTATKKFERLSARLLQASEKVTHYLRCHVCGPRYGLPEEPEDLADCGRPWHPPDKQWSTVQIAKRLDAATFLEPARMAGVHWNGALAAPKEDPWGLRSPEEMECVRLPDGTESLALAGIGAAPPPEDDCPF